MGARVAVEVLATVEEALSAGPPGPVPVLITFVDHEAAQAFSCIGVSVRRRFDRIACVAADLDPATMLAAASQPGVDLIELDGEVRV